MHIDKFIIAGTPLDERMKMLPEQKEKLREHWQETGLSYRRLGILFECSAMEAYYICNPEKYQEALKKKSASQKVDSAKQADLTKKRRIRKKEYLKANNL